MWRKVAIAAAVVLTMVVIGLVLVWQALRGDQVRSAIEERLSALLGQPVTIGELGINFSPLFSVSAAGLRIGQANVLAPALSIERIVVHPRLGPLLRRTVVIQDVELRGFVVSVLRDAQGQWRVPAVAPAAGADAESGTTIERVRVADGRIRVFDQSARGEVRETSSIDGISTTIEPTVNGLRLGSIAGRIGGAQIRGEAQTTGRGVELAFTAEEISDDDLSPLLGLLGTDRPEFLKLADPLAVAVSVAVDRSSSRLTGKGTLRAPQVLLDPLHLQQLTSPFTIAGDRLQFTPLTFTISRGSHDGAVTMRFGPSQWSIDSRVSGMNVKEFLDRLTGADQRLEGTATVNARLGGRVDQSLIQSAAGRLTLTISDGVIRDFPMLAAIDRALKLTAQEEGDTAFERMTGTFDIGNGSARTDDLVISARDVRVHASGRIGADRSLAMRGRAVLSPERSARAITSINELKGMRNERGQVEVPLTISGSLDAPSFNVDIASILKKGALDEIKRRLKRIIR
jgi:uncharacterized protein involved in outer membrane biogenesis